MPFYEKGGGASQQVKHIPVLIDIYTRGNGKDGSLLTRSVVRTGSEDERGSVPVRASGEEGLGEGGVARDGGSIEVQEQKPAQGRSLNPGGSRITTAHAAATP